MGIILAGLLVVNPLITEACPKSSKGDKKSCKMTKIKDKVKMLWLHKNYLEITDEQIEKLKGIKHSTIKDIIRAKADVEIIAVDVKSALWEDKIDLGNVNKLIDSKYDAKKKIAKAYVTALAGIQDVLNDAQNAKVKELNINAALGKDCPQKKCDKADRPGRMFCPLKEEMQESKGSGSEAKGSMK